jgi:2-polyprenyl-6-methoxyphenol hydroxylase-like FAD-dependent oxidoreductase
LVAHIFSIPSADLPEACDVCVIGAGMAGAALAFSLARAGVSVTIIDPRERYPHCFKAEKIEPEQAVWLRALGLYDVIRAVAAPIRGVTIARRGKVVDYDDIEQLGAAYHDMANAVRDALPGVVRSVLGRVTDIQLSGDRQRVRLADGSTIAPRLVALATGTGGKLHDALGIGRRDVNEEHSIAFGFSIEPEGGGRFPFDAVTYLPDGIESGIDYLTLFNFPDGMRANMFAYFPPRDGRVKAIMRDPVSELREMLPGIERVIGPWRVTSKVEVYPIPLWVSDEAGRPGLVLVADAFQSVCPATGTGLSKVLNDVGVLAELIPEWLTTPGMGSDKTSTYYANARKRQSDKRSLDAAAYRRRVATDRGLRMRIHRAKRLAIMTWQGRRRASRRG